MSTIARWFADAEQARLAMLDLLTAGIPREDIGAVVRRFPARQAPPGAAADQDALEIQHAQAIVEALVGSARPNSTASDPIVLAGPPADTPGAHPSETGGADLPRALASVGLPENEARACARALRRGGALLIVRSDDARDSIVHGVFHHYADPILQEHDETVGPASEGDLTRDDAERPLSTSIGALSGGMVPGGWGAAGAIFAGQDEATPADDQLRRQRGA